MMFEHGVYHIAAPERRSTCEDFIECATGRVNVRTLVNRTGFALLWAHVIRAAAYFADVGQLLTGVYVIRKFDYAEVDNFHTTCCMNTERLAAQPRRQPIWCSRGRKWNCRRN